MQARKTFQRIEYSNGANRAAKADSGDLFGIAAFDAFFAILVFLIFAPGFWAILARLSPVFSALSNSTASELIKAGILSLGFVGIAVKWEAIKKLPSLILLLSLGLILSFISLIWSIDRLETVKAAIELLLVFVFGIALSLRLNGSRLAAAAAFSCTIIVGAELILSMIQKGTGGDVALSSLDVSCAMIFSFWGLASNPRYAVIFATLALFNATIVIATGDIIGITSLVAIAGAYAIIFFAKIDAGEIIKISAGFGVLLFLCALLYASFGEAAADVLTKYFDDSNLKTAFGVGFGNAGTDLLSLFFGGLGIFGLCYLLLLAFYSCLIGIINANNNSTLSVAIFGIINIILLQMGKIEMMSPPFILLIACISAAQIKGRSSN